MAITGGCQCGEIRYELARAPDRVSICHCRDCQRSSGAPMMCWALMPKDVLKITAGQPKVINSSGDSFRQFCGNCGTGLFFVNETILPGIVDVQTVTLDDPAAFPPATQYQTAERIPWAEHIHKLEAHERWGIE